MVKPLHIKNANLYSVNQVEQRDLYCTNAILDQPAPDSLEVDLNGYTIYPGLTNAHDHLELNHYPRTKFREVYNNAHEWGEDVNKRLDTEPYKSLRQYPIWDRLFIGGLKNLLCGATTVAHHGPKYREMYRKDFPVRVLKNYGWSHSLHFDTEEDIVKSYQNTPKHHPWFIHLAEGTDDVAKSEYQRLKKLGCLSSSNTVIVHGVGLSHEEECEGNYNSFVTCPTTNQFLLNKHLNTAKDLEHAVWTNTLLLGSDSRLTADGDLLDEMRFTKEYIIDEDMAFIVGISGTSAITVVDMVSWYAKSIMGGTVGELSSRHHADIIALRNEGCSINSLTESERLCNARRTDLAMVITNSIPQIGDPDIMAKFPHIKTVSALLDDVPKSINISLARQIQRCKLKEHGLELVETPAKRFWIF